MDRVEEMKIGQYKQVIAMNMVKNQPFELRNTTCDVIVKAYPHKIHITIKQYPENKKHEIEYNGYSKAKIYFNYSFVGDLEEGTFNIYANNGVYINTCGMVVEIIILP